MNALDKALLHYLNALKSFECGTESYLKIDLPKLEVADELLKVLGLPTAPEESPLVTTKRDRATHVSRLRMGFVYLMANTRNRLTKIGFSTKPEYREKTLQSEEPEVKLIQAWPSSMATEYALHARFSTKRIRGEWFDLNEQDVAEIGKVFA